MAWISVWAPLLPTGVHQPGRLEDQQPQLLDLDPGLGDPVPDDALLGQRLAEGLAAVGTRAHQLDRLLGDADRPHAVVDAARTQTRLGDREAVALAAR